AAAAAAAVPPSSTAWARRFGGIVVPHGVDTALFDPARIDRDEARRDFGFSGPSVLFAGTPRGHKGLKELAVAVARVPDAHLAVACRPTDLAGSEWDSLPFQRIPLLPYDELPRLLVAADVVAIPQLDSEASAYQMPMKVYDAMAAGKPIVASAISDLPIGLGRGPEVVRDQNAGLPGHQAIERFLQLRLGLHVQTRHGLVEEENGGPPDERPRDGQPLPLAAGKCRASLAQNRVVALRKLL